MGGVKGGQARMLNLVWVGMILMGVAVAAARGHMDLVTSSTFDSAKLAVETVITLTGIMVFWLGIAKVAEQSGLMERLGHAVRPMLRMVFPSLKRDSPALNSIMMNFAANLLGLGQAATPFGLKAMTELQAENDDKETASDAMVTFLVMNTAGVTLIPATIVAYRAAAGSVNPSEIVGTTLAASLGSTIFALLLDALLRRSRRFRQRV